MLDLLMLLVKTLTQDGTNYSSTTSPTEILSMNKEKYSVFKANLMTKIDKLFLRTKETMKFTNSGTLDTRIEPSQFQPVDTVVNGDCLSIDLSTLFQC
jgi:hypothetical protein